METCCRYSEPYKGICLKCGAAVDAGGVSSGDLTCAKCGEWATGVFYGTPLCTAHTTTSILDELARASTQHTEEKSGGYQP